MKKTRTAVTMQDRNIFELRLTIGLDLGDRNSCDTGEKVRGSMSVIQMLRQQL